MKSHQNCQIVFCHSHKSAHLEMCQLFWNQMATLCHGKLPNMDKTSWDFMLFDGISNQNTNCTDQQKREIIFIQVSKNPLFLSCEKIHSPF